MRKLQSDIEEENIKMKIIDKVPIVEVFESIQGEGKNIGKPTIFIRFWGCNLRCRFNGNICDTPDSIIDKNKNSKMMGIYDIIKILSKYNSKHIIFTGGEPLLYQNFICELIYKLNNINEYYSYEVETNGTIKPTYSTSLMIDYFSVSIKLQSSNQSNKRYDSLRYNKKIVQTYPKNISYFKFVITCNDDIDEVLEIHKNHPTIKVYLMPQGTTRKDILKNSQVVVDICIKYNFIFSPREHIIIWDDRKGV